MRIIKTTLAFLIFFFILACGQNPERQARNSNNDTSVSQMSEVEPEVVQKNEATEKNLIVSDSTGAKEDQAQNEDSEQAQNEPKEQESQVSVNSNSQNFGWDWWMVGAIISIVINVFLFLLLVKTVNSKEKYRRERDDIEIGKNKYKNRASILTSKLEDLERKNSNVSNRKQANSLNQYHSNSSKKDQCFEDEKSPELILSVNNATVPPPQQEEKQPLILFAEKATENKVFTSVSEQKNEYKSIFKLFLDNSESDEAKFEVLDSDYILKMVVNSPDTYLYPVCKPENSNQNYSGEIITTIKGIAHKVEGKWIVKEENKATIKFQ